MPFNNELINDKMNNYIFLHILDNGITLSTTKNKSNMNRHTFSTTNTQLRDINVRNVSNNSFLIHENPHSTITIINNKMLHAKFLFIQQNA